MPVWQSSPLVSKSRGAAGGLPVVRLPGHGVEQREVPSSLAEKSHLAHRIEDEGLRRLREDRDRLPRTARVPRSRNW